MNYHLVRFAQIALLDCCHPHFLLVVREDDEDEDDEEDFSDSDCHWTCDEDSVDSSEGSSMAGKIR